MKLTGSRSLLLAVALVAVSLAVGACGGGDGDGSSGADGSSRGDGSSGSGETTAAGDGAPPASKAQFIKEADAICASGKEQVQSEFASYLKEKGIKEPKGEAQVAEVIETIGIPALRRQLTALESLGAPSGEESQANAYFAAVAAGIEEGEGDPQLLYTSSDKVFADADKLAGEIGFKVCGQR